MSAFSAYPHLRIIFRRHCATGSPPRMAASRSSVKGHFAGAFAWDGDKAWLGSSGDG